MLSSPYLSYNDVRFRKKIEHTLNILSQRPHQPACLVAVCACLCVCERERDSVHACITAGRCGEILFVLVDSCTHPCAHRHKHTAPSHHTLPRAQGCMRRNCCASAPPPHPPHAPGANGEGEKAAAWATSHSASMPPERHSARARGIMCPSASPLRESTNQDSIKKHFGRSPVEGSLVASFKEDWIWSEVRIERTESAGTGFTV